MSQSPNMQKIGHIVSWLLLSFLWPALAEDSGLAFLKIYGSAATAPLGSAAVASHHADALLTNPAAMIYTHTTTFGSTYGSWLQMVRFGQFYTVLVPADRHRLALSAYYMNIPGIERRFSALDRQPVDEFGAANQSLGLSYAFLPLHRLSVGMAVHLLQQTIDTVSGTTVAFDGGLQYRLLHNNLSLGVAYRNMGPNLTLAKARVRLPQTLDAGLALRALPGVEAYLGVRSLADNSRQWHAAAAWSLKNGSRDFQLHLRLGYQFRDGRSLQQGFKWGLGVEKNTTTMQYQFDYSFVPFATLGQTHLFSIKLGRTGQTKALLTANRQRFSPHHSDVTFAMTVERMPEPGSWQLRLTDKQGLLKNEFSGDGLPPPDLTWDGRDRNERILPDGHYQALLTVYNIQGVAAVSNPQTVLLDGRPPDIRLQLSPRFLTQSHKTMQLKPRLVKSLETDFINPVESWHVKILDQNRAPVKQFQGPGEPPPLLDWNLQNNDQRPVAPGNYLALAEAADIVGNVGRSDTLVFTIGFEMQAEAKNTIKENINGFVVTLGSILFDFDRATLRPAAHDVLRNIAMIMTYYKSASALIGGHTDARGSEEYNLNLSARRSEEVKRYLTQVLGIAADRLRVQWYGKSMPVATNDTDEGRQRNRRVEVTITLAAESWR